VKRIFFLVALIGLTTLYLRAQSENNALSLSMGNLYLMSEAESRSISPENITGGKSKGGMATLADRDQRNAANAAKAASDLGTG